MASLRSSEFDTIPLASPGYLTEINKNFTFPVKGAIRKSPGWLEEFFDKVVLA